MAKEIDKIDRYEEESMGEVRIADDVVANIAGLAAMEIEGVACTVGNATKELMKRMGVKNTARDVKVSLDENVVSVEMALIMKYGYNIPVTSKEVQERVKTTIETMTGLAVSTVGIKIVGIDMSTRE